MVFMKQVNFSFSFSKIHLEWMYFLHFVGQKNKATSSKERNSSSLKPTGIFEGVSPGPAGPASAMAPSHPTLKSLEPAFKQPAPGGPWEVSPGWRG